MPVQPAPLHVPTFKNEAPVPLPEQEKLERYSDLSLQSAKRYGAKRGRKPKDFAVYKRESKLRIREFKALAKDPTKSVEERKKWRSCASALKTRLTARYREEEEKREALREARMRQAAQQELNEENVQIPSEEAELSKQSEDSSDSAQH